MNAYIDRHGQVWVKTNDSYLRVGTYKLNVPNGFIAMVLRTSNELAN